MNDDIITLGGTNFPITGIVTVSAASDFEVGLKVGKVSYDNRENAFFLVMDDFTGGFGSQFLDIREELGTYWFGGSYNSPATEHPGRVTLPLAQHYVPINQSSSYNGAVDVNNPWISRVGFYLFGVGNGVYTLSTLGGQPVKRTLPGLGTVISLTAAVDAVNGEDRVYAALEGSIPSVSFSDGTVWQAHTSVFKVHSQKPLLQGQLGDIIVQDSIISYQDGSTIHTFGNPATIYFDPDGNQHSQAQPDTILVEPTLVVDRFRPMPPQYTTINAIIATGTSELQVSGGMTDMFFWDGKVLGIIYGTNKIVFHVPMTGEGLAWLTIPPGEYVNQMAYRRVGSVQVGAEINSYGSPSVTFYDPDGNAVSQDQPDQHVSVPEFVAVYGWVVTRTIRIENDGTHRYSYVVDTTVSDEEDINVYEIGGGSGGNGPLAG